MTTDETLKTTGHLLLCQFNVCHSASLLRQLKSRHSDRYRKITDGNVRFNTSFCHLFSVQMNVVRCSFSMVKVNVHFAAYISHAFPWVPLSWKLKSFHVMTMEYFCPFRFVSHAVGKRSVVCNHRAWTVPCCTACVSQTLAKTRMIAVERSYV